MSESRKQYPEHKNNGVNPASAVGRVLVTGGAGFIGSHLCSYLAECGQEVRVLDNFSTGYLENLDGIDVQVIEGDIRDPECVAKAVYGVDTVFHQAALCSVSRSVADPITTNAVNTSGTLNVFEASRQAGVKRVVYASSSSVYGNTDTLPKHEAMPTAPLSPYAVSKLTTEYYGALYSRLYGLETVGLRYFNVFGPRQDPNSDYAAVIPKFVAALMSQQALKIFGSGAQTRDFTYVSNVVQANIAAATRSEGAGQVFNIACGERRSLLELVESLEAVSQCRAELEFYPPREGDVLHSLAAIEKARDLIGYAPSTNFEEGIRKTLEWFAPVGALNIEKSPRLGESPAHGLLE